MTVIWV